MVLNTRLSNLKSYLARSVDGASLAVFRVSFGIILLWHMVKQFQVRGGRNFIDFFYNEPAFHFPYYGFEWVKPVPEPFMTLVFVAAGLAILFVAIGFLYRVSAASFFLLYTYIFLCDQTEYNNHYYLVCIIALLLAIMPAHRRFSVDAWLVARRQPPDDSSPSAHSVPTVPLWTLFILRFQVFCVYFYSGVSKANAEWLSGVPIQSAGVKLRIMLDQFGVVPAFITDQHAGLFVAWGAMLFDIIVGFLLIWRPTRWLGILGAFVFNLHNHFIFPIGIFPFLAFVIVLIFLSPNWPVQFWVWLKHWGTRLLPGTEKECVEKRPITLVHPDTRGAAPLTVVTWAFIVIWVASQTLIPLRHYFIPGDANWTEQGQKFSWRMMLRAKTAGHVIYYLKDPELQIADEKDRPQIDWTKWPKSAPRAIFIPIASERFDWALHRGLKLTYEPLNGYRLIFNPSGDSNESVEQAVKQIKDVWEKNFSRVPNIHRALSLSDAMDLMVERILAVGKARDTDEVTGQLIVQDLTLLASQLKDLDMQPWNKRALWLSKVVPLFVTLRETGFGDIVEPIILRLAPFAIQGGAPSKTPLLIVSDPKINADNIDSAFRKLSGGESYVVWLDIERLQPLAWRGLPKTLITFDRGELRLIWNHFKDLNKFQLRRFSIRPHMIHEYANNRIASEWEKEFGRRPAVYVSSLVMLNYKNPRQFIDPDVDLAGVPYKLFGSNKWILPRFD